MVPRNNIHLPALPAPDMAVRMERFDGLIERAIALSGARLVFRIPARPGSGYREIAAVARRSAADPSVTLLTLAEDGSTVAIAPVDPDLAIFHGLARSFTQVMDRWTAA